MSRLRDLAKELCKLCTGVLLIVPAAAVILAIFEALGPGVSATWSPRQRGWVAGLGAYAVLHLIFWRPRPVVAAGHSLVRRFFGLFFGEQVVPVEEGESGAVARRPAALVVFSAYFVPVFTILYAAAVQCVPRYIPWKPSAFWVCFWLGATILMHLLISIEDAQSARESAWPGGYLVTIGLMVFVNGLMLALCLHWLFADVQFLAVLESTLQKAGGMYQAVSRQLFGM